MNSEALAMMIILPSLFLVAGWLFRTLLAFFERRRSDRYHYELQNKLLDKFGTAPELVEYLSSESGSQFINATLTEPRVQPAGRILNSIQAGVVVTALGIGFLILKELVAGAQEGFGVLGVLGICLGAGFLASSWIAMTLSRRWGLIEDRATDEPSYEV